MVEVVVSVFEAVERDLENGGNMKCLSGDGPTPDLQAAGPRENGSPLGWPLAWRSGGRFSRFDLY